ncbi:MAG: TPM domain-containing protein [Breznakibacter sp.]
MKNTILFLLAILFSFNLQGQNIPDKPTPPKLVNDFAGMFDPAFVQNLENTLVTFAKETSTQVAVITVQSLDGTDAGDYAFKLGEKWGIGQKGKNNGILILLKPKTGNERGQVFIATGYGLEGAVPDAYAKRIVDKEMIPRFKQGDYQGGVSAAVQVIMELTRGEYTAEQYAEQGNGSVGVIAIFIIIVIIVILSKIFGSGTRNMSRRGSDIPFWLLMGSMASSSKHSGSWGGFSSGSGGFGGFGGGSFGGGGAGGSW